MSELQKNETPKKRGFKMPDIYIILGTFILVMALLTYIVPAGQYDRQVVETVHGVQNFVVAGTYKEVEQHPAGFFEIITAIPYGFERAAGIVVLTFMVGACMGLIKRAGLIDLGVQRLSKAVGNQEMLVAPILMAVTSLLAAFIGVPELSLAYLPVFLPLFYRLGYDGMTATAVALLGPCIGFTFGITIPGSVGMGQQIAQLPIFSGSGLRAIVMVLAIVISIAYVMVYAARVKKNPESSLTIESDRIMREEIAQRAPVGEQTFTPQQIRAGIACLILFPIAVALILWKNLGFEAIGGLFLAIGIIAALIAGKRGQEICNDINAGMHDLMVGALLCGVASGIAVVMDSGVITDTIVNWLENLMKSTPPRDQRDRGLLGAVALQRPDSGRDGPHDSDDADSLAARVASRHLAAGDRFGQRLGRSTLGHLLPDLGLLHRDARDLEVRLHEVDPFLHASHDYPRRDGFGRALHPASLQHPVLRRKPECWTSSSKTAAWCCATVWKRRRSA